ncbi:MAG: RHS repeat-associated core domain-containing protein, partial [Holophagales bacterium]|nr:RHS repeat-associated core domain-containing protein [Holophagales bacterium]
PSGTQTDEFEYDSLGNLVREVNDGSTINYAYNNLNQLLTKSSAAYSYDKRGNLISEKRDGKTATYEYDGANRMVKGTNFEGETSIYNYNGQGYKVEHIINAANQDFPHRNNLNAWGSQNIGNISELFDNLSKPTIPQVTWQNGIGLVRQEEPKEQDIYYVPDYVRGARNVLATLEVGKTISEYVYGLDRISVEIKDFDPADPIAHQTPNIAADIGLTNVKFAYYHQDRLGSTSYVTRENGAILAFANYDAWGKADVRLNFSMKAGATTTDTNLDLNRGGIGFVVAYTGHEYDHTLGVYFAQNRVYDPNAKRFIQNDLFGGEITNQQSMNRYTYCLDNPMNYTDPLGLLEVKLQLPKSAGGAVINGHLTNGKAFYYEDGKKRDAPIGTNIYTGTKIYQVTKTGVVLVDTGIPAQPQNNPDIFKTTSNNQGSISTTDGILLSSDKGEFGESSDTYKILVDVDMRWKVATNGSSEKQRLNNIATDARRFVRAGTPLMYGQDKIMNLLHTNAALGINVMDAATTDPSDYTGSVVAYSWFVSMTCSDWDYKWNPDWQVPYAVYNDKNMNQRQKGGGYPKNWIAWIYFDGMIIGADKVGQINLGYVGTKMGWPKWMLLIPGVTDDKDDGPYITHGINMANQGR